MIGNRVWAPSRAQCPAEASAPPLSSRSTTNLEGETGGLRNEWGRRWVTKSHFLARTGDAPGKHPECLQVLAGQGLPGQHWPQLRNGASLVAQLVKNPLQCGRPGFDPWVGKIPWRRERPPTPVFWAGEFHGL